jgi:hypothetical protein
MGLFSKKPASVVGPTDDDRSAVAVVPDLAGTPYRGDRNVAFRDGFYYVCPFDADGNEVGPDVSTPLVWRDGGLHYARPEDPNHFHSYGLNALELEPGSE